MRWYMLFAFATISSIVMAQVEKYDFNEFYYQRTSLFERLPITSNDIIFLGDSQTNGCEWSELFKNANVKNRGISSDVMQGVSCRLEPIFKGQPKKIFLLIGVNDISHNLSVDSLATAYGELIDKIRKGIPNTKLYVQSCLPINNDFGRYKRMKGKEQVIIDLNNYLQSKAKEKGYIYIDIYSNFLEPGTNKMKPDFTNDGLHLLGDAYFYWRDIILPYVND